ncbi:MAG: tetratricopeptide repeat protein [Burkholderiaceae bacterium]|nr:tetratricopeptide repeat protein [Burkholderiaceae bacterium]
MTDVVDSTELVRKLGDAAAAELWRAHDRLARDLLREWHGHEIDKSDGFLLLFDGCADALSYVMAYHRGLASLALPLRARAGVHVGQLDLRRNDAADVALGAKPIEVEGLAKPIAARIMSLAAGGRTLLSADARAALGAAPVFSVRSHGHWQLKGLADAIELFEAVDAGGGFEPPADSAKGWRVTRVNEVWVPTRDVHHTLPAERDRFVGRRAELERLGERLDQGARLVSVVGIGGTGKTRLATRLARDALGGFAGGVWFCDLSRATSVDGIHFAVAQGLELALGAGDPVRQIAHAIAGRGRCLVILDNFEQVARHAEATLGRWLDGAPLAQFLVTTREVLGISGEEVFALAPMGAADAIELFNQRAAAARIGYAAASDDAAAVLQLVTMLDGLPLAIELAAARVRAVLPRSLVARVRDRFELALSHGGRQDRQATLRAAFDWSWDLLTDGEKAALSTLAVFEGGISLEAAIAVIEPAGRDPLDVLDTLQRLVDKSLLRNVGDERFDLLETVRDYALRRLQTEGSFGASGPAYAADARARHWRYFAQLDDRAATAARCAEAHNLVAACRAAAAAGDSTCATGCLIGAWATLRLVGPYRAAVDLAQTVAAVETLNDEQRGFVHWVAGDALDMLGRVDESRAHLAAGIEHARGCGAQACLVRLLVASSNRQTLDGSLDDARASLREALAIARALHDAPLQMMALNQFGGHLDHQARWDEARQCFEQALALAREIGDHRVEGGLLGNLGGLHHDRGQLELAREHYEQALALASELGDQRWEGNARCNLGLLYQEQGRDGDAREQFDIALQLARRAGHVRLEYTVLCNLGMMLTAQGRLEEANAHLEHAVEGARTYGDRRKQGQFLGYLAIAQARLGRTARARESLEAAHALLAAMSDRLSLALLQCDRAEIEALAKDAPAARAAFDQAQAIAQELGCGSDSELCRRLEALAPLLAAVRSSRARRAIVSCSPSADRRRRRRRRRSRRC